jgi:septal ring factor EnvC (AmiA/AmiB activator)
MGLIGRIGAVVLVGLMATATSALAQAEPTIPLSREVAGSAERLDRIRSDIASVRAELDSLSGRREHAGRELKQVTREIGLVKELVAGLDQREKILELQRDTLQVRLVAQREAYELRKEALGARLRALYKEGPQRDLELILTSESFSSLVARYRFSTTLARLDGNLVARTRDQARAIELEQAQLQSALAGIWEAREEARNQRERLEILEAERIGLLREVESAQQRVENELAELRRQERQLVDLLARLETARQQAPITERDTRQDGAPFGDRRGDLPWPVTGTVSREFGRNVHPRFGTVTMHNGLSLAATTGAPVYAVAPGTVQFADHLPGYGRCVILDHGSGYYTLYANLARIFPVRGSRVSGGEILAEVGASGQNDQPELYFEVREGREARDPRLWLRRPD